MKFQRQIAEFGISVAGMPNLQVSRRSDGELVINDGVTRAIRVAKLLPGVLVSVEVIDDFPDTSWFVSNRGRCIAMNHTTSDALVEAVGRLRELFPEWRFGQLMVNLTTAAGCQELGRSGMWRTINCWPRPKD